MILRYALEVRTRPVGSLPSKVALLTSRPEGVKLVARSNVHATMDRKQVRTDDTWQRLHGVKPQC
jgi:hypothetical protein